VVVAVVAVRVMQVAVDQVINVVAVRDCLVAAAWAVLVIFRMALAIVLRRAIRLVHAADRELVLLDISTGLVMQMPVVQVIDMAVVNDGGVATLFAVLMRMVVMVSCHFSFSLFNGRGTASN
jgi:hypothetical protein